MPIEDEFTTNFLTEAGSAARRVPQSVIVTISARADRCLCSIDRQSVPMTRQVLLGVP